jgi:hypothetical protein
MLSNLAQGKRHDDKASANAAPTYQLQVKHQLLTCQGRACLTDVLSLLRDAWIPDTQPADRQRHATHHTTTAHTADHWHVYRGAESGGLQQLPGTDVCSMMTRQLQVLRLPTKCRASPSCSPARAVPV